MRGNGNTRSVDARVGRGLLTPGTARPKMGVTWYGVGGLSPSTPLKAGTAGLGMLPFKGQTGGAPAVLARAVFSISLFYFAVYLIPNLTWASFASSTAPCQHWRLRTRQGESRVNNTRSACRSLAQSLRGAFGAVIN